MNQRWRDRRHVFRPDEPIDPARYEVVEIKGDATARGFVERHHYSGGSPAARRRYRPGGRRCCGPRGAALIRRRPARRQADAWTCPPRRGGRASGPGGGHGLSSGPSAAATRPLFARERKIGARSAAANGDGRSDHCGCLCR